MSALTNATVSELFGAGEIVDAPVPTYAKGGAAYDDNDQPGFGFDKSNPDAVFGRQLLKDSITPDVTKLPSTQIGGRRRSRLSRKQKGGRRLRRLSRSGGKKPRFQLTLKATIRMRSRSRRLSRSQRRQ